MKMIVIAALGVLIAASLAACRSHTIKADPKPSLSDSATVTSSSGHDVTRLPDGQIEKLAKKLTAAERYILLRKGTERAFTGGLLKNEEEGIYTCRLCGLPLFGSGTKFKSGTGWPSFYEPIDDAHVHEERDNSFGVRTEIQCRRCGGHLGHVFNDGPKPTGLRYCVNSESLEFHEKDEDLPAESQPIERGAKEM
jgi:peptide-methionine (R)-S-oxide reductase